MPRIRTDPHGPYLVSGGYIARPLENRTRFSEGQSVPARHFAGSGVHGVGRSASEGRGEYTEYWFTSGTAEQHPSRGADAQAYARTVAWYLQCSGGPSMAWMRTRAQAMRREKNAPASPGSNP